MKGVWLSKSEWTPWSRTAGERGRFQHQDVRFKPGISVTHGHKSSLLLVAHDDSQATSGQGQHDLLVSPDLVTWGWAPVTQCFPPAPKGKTTRSEVSLLLTAAAFDKLSHERKPQVQERTFLTPLCPSQNYVHVWMWERRSKQLQHYIRYCALGDWLKRVIFGLSIFKCACNMVSICVLENHRNEDAEPDLI